MKNNHASPHPAGFSNGGCKGFEVGLRDLNKSLNFGKYTAEFMFRK